MVSRVIPVDPFDLTIFGGTGDLAKRKIYLGCSVAICQGKCRMRRKSLVPRDPS